MATFPTLTPSSRTFTPGEFPHSVFAGMSGATSQVRNSNVMLSSQLRLTFVGITEVQMLTILSHYQDQRGGFQSFLLPTSIWSGVSTISDYQLTSYGWVYTQPPTVTDAMCADAYDVELTLESVPPEGTAVGGLNYVVLATIASGTVAAANGFSLVVTTKIENGVGAAAGLAESIAVSLTAGSVTASAIPPGMTKVVSWTLTPGVGTGGASDGAAYNVIVSLSAGSASGADNPIPALSPVLWFDAADETTVTVASSEITQITDKGSRGWTLSKSTTGPAYSTGINGRKCIDWGSAGHSNFLHNTSTTSTTIAEVYIVLDASFGSTFPTFNGIVSSTSGASWYVVGNPASSGFSSVTELNRAFINASTTSVFSSGVLPSINSPCILRLGRASGTFNSTTGFQLGNDRTNASRGWSGLIGEVVIFSTALSSTDRTNVLNWLATKWGITI